MTPDYKLIYSDILIKKFPHKKEMCEGLLSKETLTALNIIELNTMIFGLPDNQPQNLNHKYRSYGKNDIFIILEYQKKHKINNSQLANHFRISRNTVAKWKKLFLV